MIPRPFLFLLLLPFPAPALAEGRDFCPDRPGLGTPPCVIDSGRVAVEVGLVDWTLERDPGTRTDTISAGDMLVRFGIAQHAEIQLGWTPFGHVRERENGAVFRAARVGDAMVAVRRSLVHPDGSGNAIALMPYATLPVGRMPVGAGDWAAGLVVPMSFELSDALSFGLSPEIDAAVDEDGDGRHLAYGAVVGLNADLGEKLSGALELSEMRDRDPGQYATETIAGLSLGWQPEDDLQLDCGANLGLNRNSPDVELYMGVSRRF